MYENNYAVQKFKEGMQPVTGLEIIKASTTTAAEIADIISKPCPPVIPETCEPALLPGVLAGVAGHGRAAEEKGPVDEQTARAEGAPYRAKSASLFSSADFSKRSGNTSTPLLLVLRNRGSCNYRDQREKVRGDLGILGKPLREPSLHFIDNLFREFLHINHRQHPLPGLVASPQLYRPGGGKWKESSMANVQELQTAIGEMLVARRNAAYRKRDAGDPATLPGKDWAGEGVLRSLPERADLRPHSQIT